MPARAALAGNPSDIYGGAVLAMPVRAFAARAVAVDGGVEPPSELIDAVRARLATERGLRWSSDIPVSVGLAGSSAIVIAALRSLGVDAPPLELAQLALSIERDDLGIAAGLQDRAVQAFDTPVLVEGETARVLSPARPIAFVVAWSNDAAGHSGDYHSSVNVDTSAMRELGTIAREAASAFEGGDADGLASLIDASGRLRQRVAPLSDAHEALADAARAAGFRPNSTGSGGAIVAVLEGDLDAIGYGYVIETVG